MTVKAEKPTSAAAWLIGEVEVLGQGSQEQSSPQDGLLSGNEEVSEPPRTCLPIRKRGLHWMSFCIPLAGMDLKLFLLWWTGISAFSGPSK